MIVWDAPAHGKSRPYSDFTYENAVTVMLKILNELQIKKVVLIGQSMGGYMAQSFIARHPVSEKLLKFSITKQNAVTKAGRENMLEMVSGYEKIELCRLMGIGYAGFLDDNKELQISCPSLILVGERDNTGKVKQYNKAWSKRTGIKIIWIPNAAHNSNVDNPEFVNSCIEEFLEDL